MGYTFASRRAVRAARSTSFSPVASSNYYKQGPGQPYSAYPIWYTPRSRVRPGRRTAIAVSALSGGTAAAVTAFSAYMAYKVVRPQRKTLETHAEGGLLPAQKVCFKSSDGLNLSGYFYPHPYAHEAILICHGFHGSSDDFQDPAITLQNLGYNVLTFDFRSCGGSEGRTSSAGFWEVRDVLGAIAYLKNRPEVDPQVIGLYGFSMGGATVIMAAAQSPDVKAVIADSAFASLDEVLDACVKHFFGLPSFPFATTTAWFGERFAKMVLKQVRPFEALAQIKHSGRQLPLFLIHGENDSVVPVSQVYKLYEVAAEPKQLWIVPNCRHVVAHHHDRAEYVGRIAAFFDKYLKTPQDEQFTAKNAE